MEKKKKIVELEIVDDLPISGVFEIALVDAPAIESGWMAFRSQEFVSPSSGERKDDFIPRCIGVLVGDEGKPQDQAAAICYSMWDQAHAKLENYDEFADYPWDECIADQKEKGLAQENAEKLCGWIKANMEMQFQESYNDYPEAAKENAQRALKWAEENGWGECGTPIGKARANQLAKGEPISEDTIARMAAFERHRQNSETPYGEGCGKLMWDAWGGSEGVEWAQRKLETIRRVEMSIDTSGLPPYVDEITEDKNKQKTMKFEQIDIYGYSTRFFDMCPVAIELFKHLVEMDVDMETQGMIRSAALQADRIFEIEANVLRDGIATMEDLKEATYLVGDFIDLMHEIDEETGMKHDVEFMFDHLGVIVSYFPEDQPIELAAVADLKVGDAVSWKVGGQNPRGRIREIVRTGQKRVPGTTFDLTGTVADPGYIIEIYENTDGKWKPTGKYAGRKADSILKNVQLAALKFSEVYNEDKIINMAKVLGTTEAEYKQKGMNFSLEDTNPNQDLYKFAEGYTVYKYEGAISGNSRRFCREMVGMGKFYTYAEITAMGQAAYNPGFGEGGASTYSIWNWKGGANCKHRWQKYYVTPEGKYQNKGKAVGKAGERPYDTPNHGYVNKMSKMMFADEDKQIVVGAAMIPDIEIPRIDDETKERYYVKFSAETIARIAEKFMRENRNNDTNINHTDENASSYIMETWVVEHPEDKANTVYGLGVPVGTWVVKMRVVDKKIWKMVKDQELTGFSIEGNFMSREEYEQYKKDKQTYERLMSLLRD